MEIKELSPLSKSIRVGNVELKNRLVTLPLFAGYNPNLGKPEGLIMDERTAAYYEAKSKGGYSLIIAETKMFAPYNEEQIQSYKKFADRIHSHGAKLVGQLLQSGRQFPFGSSVAPSPIPCPKCDHIPKELSIDEIKGLVKAFGENALFFKKAGYDGTEIHGAHGYLIAEFLSSYANKRFDEYGGTLENRMRFPLEIIKEVRDKCGSDFVIGFRISAEEFVPGGRTIEETKAIAMRLEKAGVDYLSISSSVYGATPTYAAPMNIPVAFLANFSGEVKKVVHIPVIVANRINDPFIAESLIVSEKTDLIGMGRQALADPELPNKFFSGNSEDIRYCIGCNQGCRQERDAGRPLACMVNPSLGFEYLEEVKSAEKSKKVAVVGGGPAGIYAAIGAAKVGHKVTLYEKAGKLGGNFALATVPPEKGSMAALLAWSTRELKKLGVTVELSTEYTKELFSKEKPDTLIIATGSKPSIPPIPGIDQKHVFTAQDILAGKIKAGKSVIVAGGGLVGCETATHLAMQHLPSGDNRKVTVVEMLPKIAADDEQSRRDLLIALMEKQHINVYMCTKIVGIKENTILLEKDGTTIEIPCDTVVLALGARPDNLLYEQLKGSENVVVVGDAKEVKNALRATRDGFVTGLNA